MENLIIGSEKTGRSQMGKRDHENTLRLSPFSLR